MIILKGYEAPTTSTPGCVGDYFIDITTDTTYKCTAVETASDTYGFLKITDATLGDSVYVWEKLGGGSEMFVIEVTENEDGYLYADKTCDDILKAIENGHNVILKCSQIANQYDFYHLTAVALGGGVCFTSVVDYENKITTKSIYIHTTNEVRLYVNM